MRGIWKQRNVDEKAWRGGVSFSPLLPCPSLPCPATDGRPSSKHFIIAPNRVSRTTTTYSRAKRERAGNHATIPGWSLGEKTGYAGCAMVWYGMAWK